MANGCLEVEVLEHGDLQLAEERRLLLVQTLGNFRVEEHERTGPFASGVAGAARGDRDPVRATGRASSRCRTGWGPSPGFSRFCAWKPRAQATPPPGSSSPVSPLNTTSSVRRVLTASRSRSSYSQRCRTCEFSQPSFPPAPSVRAAYRSAGWRGGAPGSG